MRKFKHVNTKSAAYFRVRCACFVTAHQAPPVEADRFAEASFRCPFYLSFHTCADGQWRMVPSSPPERHTCSYANNMASNRKELGFSIEVLKYLEVSSSGADIGLASGSRSGGILTTGQALVGMCGGCASESNIRRSIRDARSERTHTDDFSDWTYVFFTIIHHARSTDVWQHVSSHLQSLPVVGVVLALPPCHVCAVA